MGTHGSLEDEKKWKKMSTGLKLKQGLKLSYRHRAFVSEYISNGWDGTKAAAAVGYKNPGLMAARLVNGQTANGVVKKALDWIAEQQEEKAALTSEEIIQKLCDIVEADITDAFGRNWIVVDDPKKIPESLRKMMDKIKVQAIKSIHPVSGTEVVEYKVEFDIPSKIKAKELLMKAKGMFAPDKKEVAVTGVNFDAMIQKAREDLANEPDLNPQIKGRKG